MINPSISIEIGSASTNEETKAPKYSQELPAFRRFARAVQWAKLNYDKEATKS